MIRFSVCVEMIFDTLPLEERIERAAACGAAAIELWEWKEKDLDVIARAKEKAGVDVSAIGGMGKKLPNDPAAADTAIEELGFATETARQIGATALIIHAGRELGDVPRGKQLETLTRVLTKAAPAANQAHVDLLLEPRNARVDFPGTLLTGTDEALSIVQAVDQPNVKLLFDIYHQYVTEGSVLDSIQRHIDWIGHFHVADAPGRGKPGTGAINFAEVFELIESLDFDGYVGLEFRPTGDPARAVKEVLSLI
jgi:hydroxypyruvate isomerase